MSVMNETEKLPDGSILNRRFEDGRLDSITQVWEHPSGRHTIVRFDANNTKVEELHSIGVKMMLTMRFKGGAKISETYICNRRLVTRTTYEKMRATYPDMPPADSSLEDSNAELLTLAREERKAKKVALAAMKVDSARGRALDEFCKKMIHGECVEDAFSWIDRAPNTLGEMSRASSRQLVSKLRALGCPSLFACEVQSFDAKYQNTGHLVVELPVVPEQRIRVRAILGRIAERQGYDRDPDDGQRFQYAKLD